VADLSDVSHADGIDTPFGNFEKDRKLTGGISELIKAFNI